MNNQRTTNQASYPQALGEPFKFIAHLLDLALIELEIPDGQESGTFTLEIENVAAGGICTIDTSDFRVCLADFGYTGNWEVHSIMPMCPLCPDWDERYPIGNDFFGSSCHINGVACCETCYTIHCLTSEVKVGSNLLKREAKAS